MDVDYKKTTYGLVVLLIVALLLLLVKSGNNTNNSETYKFLNDEVAILKTKNSILLNEIEGIKKSNQHIDSLIFAINTKKQDVKYVYIEKTKQIDDGSVAYLVDEFAIVFSKGNVRR